MHYYYEGVCSWQWFYPYHYAPFASDLKDLAQLNISFDLGTPFKPFNQLLGVFPAASSHALPEQYRKLMTDPNSPIADFYPTDFEVDMNGKRFAWQGIAKLPFVDEARLLAEAEKLEHTLTEEEMRRNSVMFEMLFVASSHPLSVSIYCMDNSCRHLTDRERVGVREQIDPRDTGGMNGYISPCAGEPCSLVFRSPIECMEGLTDNQVICALYRLPDAHKHITRPPVGVVFPKKTVTVGDLRQPSPALWHEESGPRPYENSSRQNPPSGMSITGRHLGDAAHRLVASSLQAFRPPYGGAPHPPQHPSNRNSQIPRPSYNNHQTYRPSGAPTAQGFDGWVPQVRQNPTRGYGHPQQSGNPYARWIGQTRA